MSKKASRAKGWPSRKSKELRDRVDRLRSDKQTQNIQTERWEDVGAAYKGVGSQIKYSIEDLMDKVIATACNVKDVQAGKQKLGSLVTHAFHSKYGNAVKQLEVRLEQLASDKAVIEQAIARERTRDNDTPEILATAKANSTQSDDQSEEVEWANWQVRHKAEIIVLVPLLVAAMGASAVTAHANLIGTGLPVFLENPPLAWSMAALAPASGLMVKLIISGIDNDKIHRLFSMGVNGLAITFVFCWILLFADQFHGLNADGLGGDLFAEASPWDEFKATAFVAVTLLTEVTIGAVLANRLDYILRTYSPNHWYDNLLSRAIRKGIDRLADQLSDQSEQEAELKGALSEYESSLNLQIDLAELVYDARRARFDDNSLV